MFDPFTGAITSFTSDSHVAWLGSVETLSPQSAIDYPATLYAAGQTFGPSFGFIAVPEPGSAVLAVGAAWALLFVRPRRHLSKANGFHGHASHNPTSPG
jgi:hypothetical protein